MRAEVTIYFMIYPFFNLQNQYKHLAVTAGAKQSFSSLSNQKQAEAYRISYTLYQWSL